MIYFKYRLLVKLIFKYFLSYFFVGSKDSAKASAVDHLSLDTLKATSTAFLTPKSTTSTSISVSPRIKITTKCANTVEDWDGGGTDKFHLVVLTSGDVCENCFQLNTLLRLA